MNKYVIETNKVILKLPFDTEGLIFRTESVKVNFDRNTLDIGARCYVDRLKYKSKNLKRTTAGIPVNTSSIDRRRVEVLQNVIINLGDRLRLKSLRISSLYTRTSNLLMFIDWCDMNHHHSVLSNCSSCVSAVGAYSDYLWERVRSETMKNNVAARYQKSIFSELQLLFDIDFVGSGIRKLRRSQSSHQLASPPSEELQGKVLSLSATLFDGLARFVLNQQPFPLKIQIPKYLKFKDNALWVFPTVKWFQVPIEFKEDTGAYDYENGRIRSFEEMVSQYGSKYSAQKAIDHALVNIAKANDDKNCYWRMHLANIAHHAFIMMFFAHTSMNWSQVKRLQWSSDFEVGTYRQGFREVKYRAGGKKVVFYIEAAFLSKFKTFLKLRDYILNKSESDLLFISRGAHYNQPPHEIGHPIIASYYDTLIRIDPTIRKVSSRSWRLAKADWLIRNTDVSTAAIFLQDTEGTVLKHYAGGSPVKAVEEVSDFFNSLSKVVIGEHEKIGKSFARIPLGECQNLNTPRAIKESDTALPNCTQPEGCMFCDKFAVHPDEQDVRKLLSFRYCIAHTRHLCASLEHFNMLYADIIDRIGEILNYIRNIENDLVERVTFEVEEESNLDPYWMKKMEMLVGLGVLAHEE